MAKYDWSKERIAAVILDCDSLTEVLNKLGIPRQGNNSKTLRSKIEEYGLDISHFTYGAKYRKGVENYVPAAEYFNSTKQIKSTELKRKLLKEGYKENKCENPNCPCKTGYWLDNILVCLLHHINGDNTDNRLENLMMLCPNCHSQTENYAGQAQEKRKFYCKDCGAEIHSRSTYCQVCAAKHLRKVERPSKDELIEDFIELKSFTRVGEKYDVTDNTIRKWCKGYEIPSTKKELKEYLIQVQQNVECA